MSLADKLKYVRKGVDVPTASQQNLIVDILKHPRIENRFRRSVEDVRITTSISPYKAYMITDIESSKKGRLAYSVESMDAPNADDFEVLIASPIKGWANFGFKPILAEVDYSSEPAIGELVGPKHGETELQAGYPGFRYLGGTDLSHIAWVIRDRGIATGEGTIISSSGQTGTPEYFELDAVTFSSGFDGWDHSTDLSVLNVFSDTAANDLTVQFKWDAARSEYVSTDVECP
jgi:hypothetical protein